MEIDPLETRRRKAINDAVEKLSEDFECVLVLGSNYDGPEGGTHHNFRSRGNFFAVQGMANYWLKIPTTTDDDEEYR